MSKPDLGYTVGKSFFANVADMADRITELEADRESILKQMGGYVIEVTELRAKLAKAEQGLVELDHCREAAGRAEDLEVKLEKAREIITEHMADHHHTARITDTLAFLDSPNVVNQIKAEALREAAHRAMEEQWLGATCIDRLRFMAGKLEALPMMKADELLQENPCA